MSGWGDCTRGAWKVKLPPRPEYHLNAAVLAAMRKASLRALRAKLTGQPLDQCCVFHREGGLRCAPCSEFPVGG